MTEAIASYTKVPGHVLWELFLLADELANHPEVSSNEKIQYQAMDLATGLSYLVIELELNARKTGEDLPYKDSIFTNPQYEWYVQDLGNVEAPPSHDNV